MSFYQATIMAALEVQKFQQRHAKEICQKLGYTLLTGESLSIDYDIVDKKFLFKMPHAQVKATEEGLETLGITNMVRAHMVTNTRPAPRTMSSALRALDADMGVKEPEAVEKKPEQASSMVLNTLKEEAATAVYNYLGVDKKASDVINVEYYDSLKKFCVHGPRLSYTRLDDDDVLPATIRKHLVLLTSRNEAAKQVEVALAQGFTADDARAIRLAKEEEDNKAKAAIFMFNLKRAVKAGHNFYTVRFTSTSQRDYICDILLERGFIVKRARKWFVGKGLRCRLYSNALNYYIFWTV